MPKKIERQFNITVTFKNGSKVPYEELMKLDKIELDAEQNKELIENFNLVFNFGYDSRRIKQKKLNEINAKKRKFMDELKKLEDEESRLALN